MEHVELSSFAHELCNYLAMLVLLGSVAHGDPGRHPRGWWPPDDLARIGRTEAFENETLGSRRACCRVVMLGSKARRQPCRHNGLLALGATAGEPSVVACGKLCPRRRAKFFVK